MYRKKSKGWLKHADFIVIDLLSLLLSLLAACLFRHGGNMSAAPFIYCTMAIYLIIADLVVMLFFETMKDVLKRDFYKEIKVTVKQVILVEVLSCVYLFTVKEGNTYSRFVLYMTGALYLFLSCAGRVFWKHHIRKGMKAGRERSLLIVTDTCAAKKVVRTLKARNFECFTFSGIVLTDSSRIGYEIEGIPVVADVLTAADYVLREWIDEVLLIPSIECGIPEHLLHQFMVAGITTHVNLVNLAGASGREQFVEKIDGYTVLTTSLRYTTARDAFIKRALDICGGLVGCVLTGIIFIFLAPAIYLQSPGPIFFSQIRIGKNGKKFKIYKFRSMYMDAEERKKDLLSQNRLTDGMMFKLDFDPRIIGNKVLPDGTKKTGLGQFIRAASLDEFPQFFNVLKGDMSLVGTRPPTEDEWEKYKLHHRTRLAIKPGITGMWQTSGRSEITDFEEVVRLDNEYIASWTPALDVKILFKTVWAVAKRDGSM